MLIIPHPPVENPSFLRGKVKIRNSAPEAKFSTNMLKQLDPCP
jgi:hypothetical protein